jgi:hypothetical protein
MIWSDQKAMLNDGSGRPETESRRAETTELVGEKGKAGYVPYEDLLLGIGGLDPKPHFAVEPVRQWPAEEELERSDISRATRVSANKQQVVGPQSERQSHLSVC